MTYRHYFLSDRRRGALLLRRNKRIFKHIVTGNKSGALPLTIFVLTLGAANEWFTKRRAESAVQDGDGQLTRLKHPAFNRTRASACRRLGCAFAHSGPLRKWRRNRCRFSLGALATRNEPAFVWRRNWRGLMKRSGEVFTMMAVALISPGWGSSGCAITQMPAADRAAHPDLARLALIHRCSLR